jgi:hypothetical protein
MTEIAVWALWLLLNGTWVEQKTHYPDLASCEKAAQVAEKSNAPLYVCTNDT